MKAVGVLALQGDFAAHARVLRGLGVDVREVRRLSDLDGLRALVLPGGESTALLTLMQGALFATMGAGQSIAADIQYGFFNRLQLTPLRGPALIGGQLAGVFVQGGIQAITYLIVALSFGAHLQAGVPGFFVLLALAMLVAIAFGSIGLTVGLRTGNGESVQGAFPLLFVLLFLSSGAIPRDLIAHDWFQTIATYNPVSYLIEAFRSLLITGWDGEALALGFGFALLILAGGVWAATAALRTRMERT